MKRPLSVSVATRERSWDGWWGPASWLPNPDTILKNLGLDISTYRDMRTDAHIGGCIRRRKSAVRCLETSLEGTGRAKKAIESILADLGSTDDANEPGSQPGLTALIGEALDGALYGYQPIEVTWGKVGALIVPTVVQAKPPEWFCFDTENQLRFKSRGSGSEGELLPPRKFLLARQEATYLNPYGQPDLAMCYWPWQFRRAAKFWVAWLERYGGDFIVGKLPRSLGSQAETQAAYNELTEDLASMIQDSVAAIPDDGSVEIMASGNKGGSTDAHERFLMYWRGEITIALLGSNQGMETDSTRAAATASLEVGEEIRDGDARMIESVVNQLIKWTCAINWPSSPVPVWSLREQEEIDTQRPARDKMLFDAGVKFTRDYWLRTYDLEEEDVAEEAEDEVSEGQPENVANPVTDEASEEEQPADMAEADLSAQAQIDAELASDHSAEYQEAMNRMMAPVMKALKAGMAPDEMLTHLAEWYGEMDETLLQELIARGVAAGTAIGRIEAGDG